MRVRKRELAKSGIYGTVDNPIVVTKKDLAEIAETFAEVKTAPVSFGHRPDPAKPRLANVVSVTFDEATGVLTGEVAEHDTLADAVDQGFYPDCSIGAKRRAADNMLYLHHLAYLGEQPPAVKDLIKSVAEPLTDPVSNLTADQIAASDAAGCAMLPSFGARQLMLSDPENPDNPDNPDGTPGGENNKEEAHMPDETDDGKPKTDPAPNTAELDTLKAENAKLKEMLKKLSEKYPDESIELSDSDPRVSRLMKELKERKREDVVNAAKGKIPKAKLPLVLALADSFSSASSIELSDGDEKKNVSQADLLRSILDQIPPMVTPGRLNLSDGDDEGEGGKDAEFSGRDSVNSF